MGECVKRLPDERRNALPSEHRAGPARLRDLIAHSDFALGADIIWDAATRHLPPLLDHARALRQAEQA